MTADARGVLCRSLAHVPVQVSARVHRRTMGWAAGLAGLAAAAAVSVTAIAPAAGAPPAAPRSAALSAPSAALSAPAVAAPPAVAPVAPVISEPAPRTAGVSVAEQTLPDGRSYRLAGDLDGSEPRPLIVALHGLRLSPDHLDSISGLTEFAAGRHAAVAYGRGLDASWNAGPCCGESARRQVDDLAYLEAVVAHTAARVPIDRARVYAVGFSTGGMMAARAACERPDLFAAAASVAGPLLVPCPNPSLRLLDVHGEDDPIVPIAGGWSSVAAFAFPREDDIRARLRAQHPDATYDLVRVPGLGHEWATPARGGYDTTGSIWSFLTGQPRWP